MSSRHEDYVREQRKGELHGGNAIDTGTAGGRAAHYEHIGKQMGGGGLVALLLFVAVLTIWPVAVMALASTAILLTMKKWVAAIRAPNFWGAFRGLYLASLTFSATMVVAGFFGLVTWNDMARVPGLSGALQAVAILLPFALSLLTSAWALRKCKVVLDADIRQTLAAVLALMAPAIVAWAWFIAYFAQHQLGR